ncbi:MAG TPA: cellulase family glycosylhydrolase [Acidimicrobiales bacterium]|nr:cellulase family glycosylhydrolase [Acidimicrobiales bacterium]
MRVADRFRLGANYWPAATAMDWLPRYDGGVVRRDFSRMAAAGLDTVRIFLRWDDVQPSASTLDAVALAAVVDTADAAADAGIELIVTLFTGHMSGVNWVPAWATGGQEGDERFRVVSGGVVQPSRRILWNWYSDVGVRDAQAYLAHGVASALAGHPAVWAWDLGNESSNCTIPPDRSSGAGWMDRMSSILRACDPRVLVTIGTHMEDLEQDRVLGPAEVAPWCDFVCMHGYPIYADWSEGPTDDHLVPFLAEITSWLAGDTPVLFAEFGQSTASPGRAPDALEVSDDAAAGYAARVLDALRANGSMGALAWCYSDYEEALNDWPPFDSATHERRFGLWRADGTAKPSVAEFATRAGRPRRSVEDDRPWLDVTPAEFASDRRRQLRRLYRRYRSR